MKHLILLLALSVFLLSGCSESSKETIPVSNDNELAKQSVPIKGNMSGFSDVGGISTCSPPFAPKHVDLSGEVSHLGKSTMHMEHCLAATSTSGGLMNNGYAVITAANGDELHAVYDGYFVFDTYPPTMANLYGTGTIVGGTGRFADATGTLNASAVQDLSVPNPTPLTLNWTGEIKY